MSGQRNVFKVSLPIGQLLTPVAECRVMSN